MAQVQVYEGDLLDQPVDVIVNSWNRNIFPWWLLLPSGFSGAIQKRAGLAPFRELAKMKLIPLGGAVATTAGTLPCKANNQKAGINLFWRSSDRAICDAVNNALKIAARNKYRSIAFPLIGTGAGGYNPDKALAIMQREIGRSNFEGEIRIVRFSKKR